MSLSLRARVLVVLLVVAAAVATGVDAVTYLSLRSFLLRRVDQQLDAAHRPLVRALVGTGSGQVSGLSDFAPGLYVEVRGADGEILDRVQLRRPDRQPLTPDIPPALDVPDLVADGDADDVAATRTTTGDDGGEGRARYRVATWRITPSGRTLVLALPLGDVDSTLRRLLAVELAVTAAALAAGLVLARSLLALGLRPLDDIATTAGAIAGGDLSRRVSEDERTEIGRLGASLNAMLGQIELAFTERRATEDRLRRFVADASHELRTPLASIRAYAELFDRGADRRPEDLARVLGGIEREAARMGVLVDDLLLLARLDQGRVLEGAPVDLGALAAEAVDAARALDAERPLHLRVDGSVEVLGDRARLRQVVDNLLANVRAHTPERTPASVVVRAEPPDALLIVEDEGPGIPAPDRERLFERFYRADPSRSRDAGGAGLGLAIVAAIAVAHGGRAEAIDAPSGGAAFVVRLPLLTGPDS